MRFLLAASKGKWFKGKHTASFAGLFVTFGIMGVWHGLGLHYILYGFYHAALLAGYDWFARWNKERKVWADAPWQVLADRLLTFHAIAFGLLLFSGRLTPPPPPPVERVVEKVDCNEVTGLAWDRDSQKKVYEVDLFVDDALIDRRAADEFREDLKDRGFGNGKHGFRFQLPWWVRDGRPHIVEVRDIVTGIAIKGSPYTLECERNEEEIQREEEKLRRAREGVAPPTPGSAPAPQQ
jgi:membrane protein involved in D-alanine export